MSNATSGGGGGAVAEQLALMQKMMEEQERRLIAQQEQVGVGLTAFTPKAVSCLCRKIMTFQATLSSS